MMLTLELVVGDETLSRGGSERGRRRRERGKGRREGGGGRRGRGDEGPSLDSLVVEGGGEGGERELPNERTRGGGGGGGGGGRRRGRKEESESIFDTFMEPAGGQEEDEVRLFSVGFLPGKRQQLVHCAFLVYFYMCIVCCLCIVG